MQRNSFDSENMFQAIYDFPEHLEAAREIGHQCEIRPYSKIQNIVVAGMGGSAIGGDIVKLLTRKMRTVPMIVSRHYKLPEFVNENSLVICSSYSGNTEETLSAFGSAQKRNAHIIGLSTGGTLSQQFQSANLDWVKIPEGLQPRAALGFSLVPMLFILKKLGLIKVEFEPDLISSINLLRNLRENYTLRTDENPTRVLAQKIHSCLPLIYGETNAGAVIALRWKGQLSENAKMLAFHNELPEMNHNEIVGWENNPEILKKIFVLWLCDEGEHPRINIRRKTTKNIINNLCAGQAIISSQGVSEMERWLQLIHFGDWLSYWCANFHQTDPTPVEKISHLKQILAQS
ncbi:MAG: bifunctional phosphoglucose/phosphomannose isomerase [Fidelibacterota bacterium]